MIEALNAMTFIARTPQPGGAIREREYQLKFKELLTSQKKEGPNYLFAVGVLEDERVAAAWEGHASVFNSLADMLNAEPAVLNSREKILLEFGAHK